MEKQQILIVDDEKNIRLTISQSLEPLDIPVQTAISSEDALQKLRENPFLLVFLDLKMPGMDINPKYKPARTNLKRTISWKKFDKIDLGPAENENRSQIGP